MSEFAERRDEDENNNPDEVDEEEDENSPEKQVIQEEYRVWKKNSPYLYDFVMTYSLDWPSLTTQWLPDHIKASKSSSDAHDQYSQHKLILGTQSDGTDQNYLMIADVSVYSL
jgi:histone-binding protein RBBP4